MNSDGRFVSALLLVIVLLLAVIAFKTLSQTAGVHGATPVQYKAIFTARDVTPLNELGKEGWHVVAAAGSGGGCCIVYMEK